MRAGFCRKPLNQWFEQQTEDEPTQLPTGAPQSGNQGVTARPVRDPGGCSRPDRSSSYFEDQTENKIQGQRCPQRAASAKEISENPPSPSGHIPLNNFSTQNTTRSEPSVANQRSTGEPEVSSSEPEASQSEPK